MNNGYFYINRLIIKSMQRIILIVLLWISSTLISAQADLDKLMTHRAPDCEDIAYNCSNLFVQYYESNQSDSAKIILDYWQQKCGLSEPLQRSKIMYSLWQNQFSDSVYSLDIIEQLNNFKVRESLKKESDKEMVYTQYKAFFGYVPVYQNFDKKTTQIFCKLKQQLPPAKLAYHVADFYCSDTDSLYDLLQKKRFRNTKMHSAYHQQVEELLKMPDAHLAIYSGIWIPDGKASKLGMHPVLGFQLGTKINKYLIDLSVGFKFGDTREPYLFTYNDSTISTDYFFGAHVGLDMGRELYRNMQHELDLLAGIAFEGFDAINRGVWDEDISSQSSVNTYNLNVGLGYRFYFKNMNYLGIQVRYNFIDYTLKNRTALSGNATTLKLLYGISGNREKAESLRELRYKRIY
jgi:hypothetical protein